MDPYLEDPALWGDVHHTLISALRRQITERLPEGYLALIQERIYLERPTRRSVGTYPTYL
jgi:hypothetical protein